MRLCGVRGSTPAPGPEFVGVGGHTSCVAIAHDDGPWQLILDAGTGIRTISPLLGGEPFHGTILLGHLHLDHTQGLPFFTAGDREDAIVRLLLPAQGEDAEAVLARCYSPPHFPIGPDQLRGTWTFGSIEEGIHEIEGFTVMAREIPHAGGRTFGFRISDGHSSVAYLSDHGPGDEPGALGPALELSEGVDALIHDSQFTTAEQARFRHFGHATPAIGLDLAERAGARQLVLYHHAPQRIDDDVESMTDGLETGDVRVVVGRQGMELHLP